MTRTAVNSDKDYLSVFHTGFTKMAYCSSCGSPISADARFCAQCGTKLIQQSTQRPTARKETVNTISTKQVPYDKRRKSLPKTIVTVAAAILISMVVVAIIDHDSSSQSLSNSSDDDWVNTTVKDSTLAANDKADLIRAGVAGRDNDDAGLAALYTSGRIHQITEGTKVYSKCDGGIAYVMVKSGSLIGQNLYMPCAHLNK
jgi:uncharacterized OB-fold protein